MSLDTFVKNVNISVRSLNLSQPQNLSCVITTNTDINTTKLDNIMKVVWYQYNGTRNKVPLLSNNYRVYLTARIGAKKFESKVKFVQVKASMAGQYTCVVWIGEEIYRNMSDYTDVTVKCKYKIIHTHTHIYIIMSDIIVSIPQFLITQDIPLLLIP